MKKIIAVLPGDGVGEEVMKQALRVLEVVSRTSDCKFETRHGLIGGAAYDETGEHFPESTRSLCEQSDAILFGSVGGPVSEMDQEKWMNCEANSLLGLRKTFGFNSNFRPVKVFPMLSKFCPLKQEIIENGVDILFVRELLGDIYFGEKRQFEEEGTRVATDVARYDEKQIESVAHQAFKAASLRSKKVRLGILQL